MQAEGEILTMHILQSKLRIKDNFTLMALLGPLNWKWYQYSTRRDTRPRMKPVHYITQYSTVQYSTVHAVPV